jgi:hypothetical protein
VGLKDEEYPTDESIEALQSIAQRSRGERSTEHRVGGSAGI